MKRGLPPLVRALRPEQWVKNLFVFAALLFGQEIVHLGAVERSVLAFFIFCGLSGTVYLLTDLRDLEQDRLHPVKRHRPLAAGEIARRTARITAFGLGSLVLAASVLLPPAFRWCALGYLLLNILYSFGLKNVVIVDVLFLAGGFVLRVVAGAEAIPVKFSQWLILCTLLLALFLGFGKRRQELTLFQEQAEEHRASLREYSLQFLDQMITVVLSATVVAYCLYTMSPQVVSKLNTDLLPLTIPFVLYGIFRYLFLIHHRHQGGSPTRTLFTDIPLLADVGLWAVSVIIILYLL
ncbi:MAG: decaprenyl-phosphate phosphoribosyltransferase [Acidobacteriota bacterium]